MKKICIIKLASIGDVLRTTPILKTFSDSKVSWITSKESHPILKNNPFIQNIFLIENLFSLEEFDELYNFDEDERACKLAETTPSHLKKGYGWKNGGFYPFDKDAEYAYNISKDNELKFKLNKKTYQQIIFEMAGKTWKQEDYVLGYHSANSIKHTVGLNYMVGKKFPSKLWVNWRDLVKLIPDISVQNQFKTLEEYIDWINSCNIIVTSDSLGMHIALALKKEVITLFGNTSMAEIEMYDRGIKLSANLSCSPCYKKQGCNVNPTCMESISAKEVYIKIKEIIKQST